MADPVWWTAARDRTRRDAVFDQSFEAVCLFSALGIVLTLLFLLTFGEAFELGLMEDLSYLHAQN
jgi:hypothetical protein